MRAGPGLPPAAEPGRSPVRRPGHGEEWAMVEENMVDSGNDGTSRLRRTRTTGADGTRIGDEPFARGGFLGWPEHRLSQVVSRRPAGITAHQWTSASRARFDYYVRGGTGHEAAFAVVFEEPARRTADSRRGDRMTDAVCEAVGLELLRVESGALTAAAQRRRIVEYLMDALAYQDATAPDPEEPADLLSAAPPGYRDIIGRLPDGRSGFVNDLGALARAAAVDAYASRRVADPIVRGLRLRWKDGPAEGWAWLRVRDDHYLVERVLIRPYRFSCGVDPARLAEDLAVMAIGERLKPLDAAEPELSSRDELARELDALCRRRDEMQDSSALDHAFLD